MKCRIDDTIYTVGWSHAQLDPVMGMGQAITVCHLATGTEQVDGFALCSTKDVFSKETGRKVSLARALKESRLDREVRTQIWHRYHHRNISDKEYYQ